MSGKVQTMSFQQNPFGSFVKCVSIINFSLNTLPQCLEKNTLVVLFKSHSVLDMVVGTKLYLLF